MKPLKVKTMRATKLDRNFLPESVIAWLRLNPISGRGKLGRFPALNLLTFPK